MWLNLIKNKTFLIFFLILLSIIFFIIDQNLTDDFTAKHKFKYILEEQLNKITKLEKLNSDYWLIIDRKSNTSINYVKSVFATNDKFNYLTINSHNNKAVVFTKVLNFIPVQYVFNYENTSLNNFYNEIYLQLIKSGAKYIYEIDDSLIFKSNDILSTLSLDKNEFRISYKCDTDKLVNIYAHFGQPNICQRGYPCASLTDSFKNNRYVCAYRKTSIIQHSLIDIYPDVDASYADKLKNWNNFALFDNTTPSVQIPNYKLSPFSSSNTFYHYEAFWALYMPKSSFYANSDILRSYWSQRLLWLLNETVTFHGPNANRNLNVYKASLSNKPIEFDINKLVDLLLKWKCSKSKFYECVVELTKLMSDNNYWNTHEVSSVTKWVSDLTALGYQEPAIINFEHNVSLVETKCDVIIPNGFYKYNLVYVPNLENAIEFDKSSRNVNKILKYNQSVEYLTQFCNASQVKLNFTTNKTSSSKEYPDIILIISFNYMPVIDNVILLKNLYFNYFKNIIFCAPGILSLYETLKSQFKLFEAFTFIELDNSNGYFHYYCMTKAIELGFKTRGYLLLSDDVLLKYWRLSKEFNFDLMGESFIGHKSNGNEEGLFQNYSCPYELRADGSIWYWWKTNFGFPAVNRLWNNLQAILNDKTPTGKFDSDRVLRFINGLNGHANYKTSLIKFCIMGSDIFYIPRSKFDGFHFFSELFRRNEVFLELSLSSMIAGLDEDGKSIQKLDGEYHWRNPFNMNMYDRIVQ